MSDNSIQKVWMAHQRQQQSKPGAGPYLGIEHSWHGSGIPVPVRFLSGGQLKVKRKPKPKPSPRAEAQPPMDQPHLHPKICKPILLPQVEVEVEMKPATGSLRESASPPLGSTHETDKITSMGDESGSATRPRPRRVFSPIEHYEKLLRSLIPSRPAALEQTPVMVIDANPEGKVTSPVAPEVKATEPETSPSDTTKGFDFCRHFGIAEIPEPGKPYDFDVHHPGLFPEYGEKGLSVPKSLALYPTPSTSGHFKGRLLIRNISRVNMAYLVKCSTPDLLYVREPRGYLGPKETREIQVMSDPTECYNSFKQLEKSEFLVLTSPVYFRKQLTPEKIDLLWDAYENEMIHQDCFELHKVRRITFRDNLLRDICEAFAKMCGYGSLPPWPWADGKPPSNGKTIDMDHFHKSWNLIILGKHRALLSEFQTSQLKLRMEDAPKLKKYAKYRRILHLAIATMFAFIVWMWSTTPFRPPFAVSLGEAPGEGVADVVGDNKDADDGGWLNWPWS